MYTYIWTEWYNFDIIINQLIFEMQIVFMGLNCFIFQWQRRIGTNPHLTFYKLLKVGVRPFLELNQISDKIGWSDFRRGSSLPSVPSTAGTMFSKLKSGTSSVSQGAQVLSTNNILNLFEVGKFVCSAGPELIWKVYEGFRKPDGKVSYRRSGLNIIFK